MEMVRKNAPQGLHVRTLTTDERSAVINVSGGGKQGKRLTFCWRWTGVNC